VRDFKIGDIVTVVWPPVHGVLVGIMGDHCKIKSMDSEGIIDFWCGRLSSIHMDAFQDWFQNVCPWERRHDR